MPQSTYSPDLVPADFFLLPKLKTPMKGRRFAAIEEMKDTKKRASKVFRGLEKNAGISA